MKKNIKILSLLLVLVLTLVLSACGDPEKLEAPEIFLNETSISWLGIENSNGYKVFVNDEEFETTSVVFDLKDIVESSYEITVVALGDGKDFADSDPSNKISITPANKVELDKLPVVSGKLSYKLKVSSNADVLGFVFEVSFPNDKLTLTEANVKWNTNVPTNWVRDVNVEEGLVTIAITGLDPISVRLLQTFLTLEFTGTDANANVKVESFVIDNG
ncbi:MAG: hypothetical protein WC006_00470 [Bacilli bacterium]|nr:hypothetical protein [Bacilli bacterium]